MIQLACGGGKYHTDNEDSKDSKPLYDITVDGVKDYIKTPLEVEKSEALWCIPSTEITRSREKQLDSGQFHILWADLDQNVPAPPIHSSNDFKDIPDDDDPEIWYNHPWEGLKFIMDSYFKGGYAIYASKSASYWNPKCRILLFLDKPIAGKEFSRHQESFNNFLEPLGFIPDRCNETANQLFYLPNKGEYYSHHISNGQADLTNLINSLPEPEVQKKKEAIPFEQLNNQELMEAIKHQATREMFHELLIENDYKFEGIDNYTYQHPDSSSGPGFTAKVIEKDGVLRFQSFNSNDILNKDIGTPDYLDCCATLTDRPVNELMHEFANTWVKRPDGIKWNGSEKITQMVDEAAHLWNLNKDDTGINQLGVELKKCSVIEQSDYLKDLSDKTGLGIRDLKKQLKSPVKRSESKLDFQMTGGEYPKPLANIHNLQLIIDDIGMVIQHDRIGNDVIVYNPDNNLKHDDYRTDYDTAIGSLKDQATNHGIHTSIVKDYIGNVARINGRNPVKEVLSSMTRSSSFEDPIKDMVHKMNFENKYWAAIALRRWMIQSVAAAYNGENDGRNTNNDETFVLPKFENMLVLYGGQGVGKTSFFNSLIPHRVKNYFADGLLLDLNNKDSVITILKHWIVELGEVDATFKKSDISALKAMTSKQVDEIRFPYGEANTKIRRHTSFCGSVNDIDFLRDTTGNRRFWPVTVTGSLDLPDNIDINDLWAYARDCYLFGHQWWLTTEEEKIHADIVVGHEYDPFNHALLDAYAFGAEKTSWGEQKGRDILEAIDQKPSNNNYKQLKKSITKLGGEYGHNMKGNFYIMPPRRAF